MLDWIASAGSALFGHVLAKDRQDDAQDFSAQQFATRYQTTVKDMQAAGLNPMLAYGQGGGSPPSSSAASADSGMQSSMQAVTARRVANAQIANVEADTENKKAQAALIEAQAAQANASAAQSHSQVEVNTQSVAKMRQEIVNLATDNQRVAALIDNVRQEYQNLVKQGYNLTEVGNHLRAQVSKLQAEIPVLSSQDFLNRMAAAVRAAEVGYVNAGTDFRRVQAEHEGVRIGATQSQSDRDAAEAALKNLDVKAAEALDNLGRNSAQFKTIVDVLKIFSRGR